MIYLISHSRPLAQLLQPARRDMRAEFERGFIGMTEVPVTLADLETAREQLIAEITGAMPDDHVMFLQSFERGAPDWSILGIAHAHELPAVPWRMENLARLSPERREQLARELTRALDMSRT